MGIIESSFGKSGKLKVFFQQGLSPGADKSIVLRCKRYVFDENRKRLKQ